MRVIIILMVSSIDCWCINRKLKKGVIICIIKETDTVNLSTTQEHITELYLKIGMDTIVPDLHGMMVIARDMHKAMVMLVMIMDGK